MPLPATFTCQGCKKGFKRDSDLTRHLRASQDQRCVAVAREELDYIPQLEQDVDMDAGAGEMWHGDFFGAGNEYNEDDFPLTAAEAQAAGHSFGARPPSSRHNTPIYPNTPPPPPTEMSSDEEEPAIPGLEEMSDSEDESDEDDEDSDVDDIDGDVLARLATRLPNISPPTSPPDSPRSDSPSPSTPSSPHRSSPVPSLDDLDEEFGRILTEQELDALYRQLTAKPVVEAFPETLGHPGAPVNPRRHRHAYEKARDALNDTNLGNPWSPLTSGLEWDVARWAKLHGPSSTALTELLKIDGVSWFRNFISDPATDCSH